MRISEWYGFMFWIAAVTLLRLISFGFLIVSMALTAIRAAIYPA